MNCPYCGAEELPFFDSIRFQCGTESRFSGKPKGLFTKEEIRGFLIKQGFTRSHTCYQRREAQLLALIGEAREVLKTVADPNRSCHYCPNLPEHEPWCPKGQAQSLLPQLDKVMEVK